VAPWFNSLTASDDELMRRSQANDTQAFEQLYDRYGAMALTVARGVCQNTGRAEDAVQEGFLSMWRSRASYHPETGSFKNWSMRIVRNRAIDSARRDVAGSRLLADPQVPFPDPASGSLQDEIIAREESDAMRASLRRLPHAQAEVITLAFYANLTRAEIARQLSVPPGTVKGRIRLGLDKLRRQLEATS
jgi:RNA polymerase sigma-70 factor (ECF subfamily)